MITSLSVHSFTWIKDTYNLYNYESTYHIQSNFKITTSGILIFIP